MEKNNSDFISNNLETFYILAGIIYSLYPSILHFNSEMKEINSKEDVDLRTLFYFLNNEEYFDYDVYIIFDHILTNKNFKHFIQNFNKLSKHEWDVVSKEIIQTEEILPSTEYRKTLISNLNRIEKISYFYLKIANNNLLDYFASINLDIYEIVMTWFTSFLTSSIAIENLPYLWDNIFMNSVDETVSFEFLDYILVALLNNCAEEVMSLDVVHVKKMLMSYPVSHLNLKDVIKKAFKIKEKINDL